MWPRRHIPKRCAEEIIAWTLDSPGWTVYMYNPSALSPESKVQDDEVIPCQPYTHTLTTATLCSRACTQPRGALLGLPAMTRRQAVTCW